MKTVAEDLAICGGTPAFAEPLHVGRPNIPDVETFLTRVRDIIDRKWLTNNGPCVQELERRLCEYLGTTHCIPICNGTIALDIAIRAAGLKGEVIVPSFTFIATCNALALRGIKPVFCDVDPVNHLLAMEAVEKAITPSTTGILAVHTWGQFCIPEAIQDIADRHGLTLLFDAAHAFGCSRNGRMVGNFGSAEVFSFHATKFFNTFEGGAIATNDDRLAERIRLDMNFGFSGYDNAELIGTNGKMSEIHAAMGLTGLTEIDDFICRNRTNYNTYRSCLDGVPGIRLLEYSDIERSNYQYVVVDVDPRVCPLTRDNLLNVLWQENVLARRYFFPGCHRMPAYRNNEAANVNLPGTDRASEGVLVLPTGTSISTETIETIAGIIKVSVANADTVTGFIRAASS